jgi:formylglycine-generating enzyme required for sulfatase activity
MAGKNFDPDRRKRAAAADQSLSSQPTIQGALEGPTEGGSEITSLSDVLTLRQRARFKIGDLLLGRYKILGELGQGGMGLVFKCLDEVGGVEVALKMLPPEVSHDTGEMEEVRENFQLVSRLAHPNICTVRTLERDANGDYFLIMEYAPGINLRKWNKGRALSPKAPSAGGGLSQTALPEILPVLRQIATALDYAHSQKIIHRDIKPANVMIAPDGGVKVLDFGLATQVHTSMSRVSHVRYGTSGTGPYMAPEQWEGQYQDARTDQYAFAVLAYELLSGRLPFENPDAMVLRNAVLHSAPKKPEGLDAKTWDALKIGLAKERDQRFASCTQFVEALGGKKVLPQRTQRSQSKKVWFGLAAAVLLLAAYPVYRGCQNSAERRAKETAQAAEAARLDAQKREQAAALQREAEAALTAGELEKAGAKIAELEQLTGKDGAAVKDLNTKYEAKAGERETNSRYAKASLAREAAQKIDRGESLGAQLDELELKWREAEAARQGKTWGQALKAYDLVIAQAKTLAAADVARTAAKEQKTTAEAAGKKAESAQAASDAAVEFTTAQKEEKAAAMAFGQGDFAGASKAWKKAAELFQGSEKNALAVQAYRAAKTDFEQALAPDADVLKAHGGAKWNAVQEQARLGGASASDPTVGRQAFADALAKLPMAVTEARERERQAKLTAALAAARTSRSAQQWEDVMRHAESALALENGNAEAKRLKAEAEQNLTPSLKLVVEAGGQEVAARIESGGQSWTAPHTFTLASDKRYVFNVTFVEGKRRWKTEKLELTADWRGPRTKRVTLEEQKEPQSGESMTVDLGGGVKMDFAWIPAGEFLMGSPTSETDRSDTEAQHRVTLSKGFWMGRTEVTQSQWERVMGSNPSNFKGANLPVEMVSWNDCQDFIRQLNGKVEMGNWKASLPTEAQWEYACRAGTTTPFHYGSSLDASMANFDGNYPYGGGAKGEYRQKTTEVGSFRPNAWGLYDMHGNVWEWCQDWYGNYGSEVVRDPTGPDSGSCRVLRGGSWLGDSRLCRSALRGRNEPGFRYVNYGLRLVLIPR